MRRTISIILLLYIVLSAYGQDFNTNWIYAPQADSTSHVWFRREFISDGRPRQAFIKITSTGYYKLYVNECNIGTALFYPYRQQGDTSAIEMTFDVTPYMRSDSNVVAILYSPVYTNLSHHQIAVNIFGKNHNDSAFSFTSDESWLCRRANSSLTSDGGELIDGRYHDPSWKAATIYNLALWKHAKHPALCQNKALPIHHTTKALYNSRITSYSPSDFTLTEDSINSLQLPFGFYGYIRATIREAKEGEEISIGNIHYICNGKIDEQAYPLFTINDGRTIPIIGDDRFKTSHIMSLEVVDVRKQMLPSF